MAFIAKPGTGALFKNDKDGNEKRPDYRGEITLESGETLKISAWIKEGQKGKFMSLALDKPREDRKQVDDFRSGGRGEAGSGRSGYDSREDPFGGDVPF